MVLKTCVICENEFDGMTNANTCSNKCRKARKGDRDRLSANKPEVKARRRDYIREYHKRPEVKARVRTHEQQPEVKARKKRWYQKNKAYVLERTKVWAKQEEVKARRRELHLERNPPKTRQCVICSAEFETTHGSQVTCGKVCRNERKHLWDQKKYKENIQSPEFRVRRRLYGKEYRQKNRERAREWKRGYRQQPRVRVRERLRLINRRAKGKSLPNTLTGTQWEATLNYFNGCCAVCGRQLNDIFGEFTASMDHWIPLSYDGDDNPGTVVTNIVPLCHGVGGCNNSKHDNLASIWLRQKYSEYKARKIERRIQTYFESVKS